MPPKMRGVSTVAYTSNDHAAAKAWFTRLLGVEPYFDRSGYAEFRIGDYQQEFGLLDGAFAGYLGGEVVPADGRAGAIVYWHVDDAQEMVDHAVALGAKGASSGSTVPARQRFRRGQCHRSVRQCARFHA